MLVYYVCLQTPSRQYYKQLLHFGGLNTRQLPAASGHSRSRRYPVPKASVIAPVQFQQPYSVLSVNRSPRILPRTVSPSPHTLTNICSVLSTKSHQHSITTCLLNYDCSKVGVCLSSNVIYHVKLEVCVGRRLLGDFIAPFIARCYLHLIGFGRSKLKRGQRIMPVMRRHTQPSAPS